VSVKWVMNFKWYVLARLVLARFYVSKFLRDVQVRWKRLGEELGEILDEYERETKESDGSNGL